VINLATSIFDVKTQIPSDDNITEALGSAKELWDTLKTHICENYKGTKNEWKFYSKKSGWTLIFKKKGRTLLYFIPCKDYFKVFFVFGENAINAVKNALLPEQIMKHIFEAATYVEGTSFDVEVKNEQDLESVYILLKIKDEV
jgi:Protein of unknown function (DUF3788)